MKNSDTRAFWQDTKRRFSLREGSAPEHEVVDGITSGIYFRGANMWILMLATLVASLGLNVDSTAVIIGAMLISPLMGPITGFGLAVGINDFWLMNRSLRNFGFMTVTAIVTATLFFFFVPLSGAQSELLARTQPTIFDVMIAFFGGAAGVVAYTRKDRTMTVISGVAIATALMPPLCTAGYGIATGQWMFFGGALYLFLINFVFIALATYVIVRAMRYSPKAEVDRRTALRVKRVMWTVVAVMVLPSVLIAVRLVDKSVFEINVGRFVEAEFRFDETAVIERNSHWSPRRGEPHTVTLMLAGEPLHETTIENIRGKMPLYDLTGVELTINQAGGGSFAPDLNSLQQGYAQVLEEKNRQIAELRRRLASAGGGGDGERAAAAELRAIIPTADSVSIARHTVWGASAQPAGTLVVCVVHGGGALTADDDARLKRWFAAKYVNEKVKIYVE